ncbi:aspartate aminotransferase family protein [Eubacterium pyruvativorans]|uniref:aspartate aminotransferase family protein n=1 Tax=Eubacterium pyruvativorans TaxID=155865 RepID=UPI0013D7D54C|nr:aspartate aminotransferase family protein [Eubacterium pyruvativorans]
MSTQGYITEAEQALLHAYNRFQVVFDHGEGVYLYDEDGKKYLDFAAGIAVNGLGYSNEKYQNALKNQVEKLIHISNLYYNKPITEAAEKVLASSGGMDRIFFTNSGTEANECAMKAAKKYAFVRDGCSGHEIIAMEHAFHGRTLGALSVTGTKHYRDPFEPLIPGCHFAEFNNLDSVKALVNENTCAIMLETIQGEGGIYPATPEFLSGIRKLCDEKDILLILDEIQCGMGRSGHMFAWEEYGIRPDIMTVAKALGCGVPVGAVMMTEKVAQHSLVPGDHGTTYGGNPFVGAAVSAVQDIFREDHIVEHVAETAPYLEAELEALVRKHDCLLERRGKGFLQGVQTTLPVGEVAKQALDTGLVVITAGKDVIRLTPPLIIEKEHIDEMIEKLDAVITGMEK